VIKLAVVSLLPSLAVPPQSVQHQDNSQRCKAAPRSAAPANQHSQLAAAGASADHPVAVVARQAVTESAAADALQPVDNLAPAAAQSQEVPKLGIPGCQAAHRSAVGLAG